MSHNKRIFLGAVIAVIVITVPVFLITPVSGVLIAAYVAALAAAAAVTTALYLAVNRKTGLFVTTAGLTLVVWRYAIFNILYSGVILDLYCTGAWKISLGWFVFGHILLAALYGWKFLAGDAGREEIEKREIKVRESIANWKHLQLKTSALASRAKEPVKKAVESVRDAVRYADPVTSPQLEEIEMEIERNIDLLSQTIQLGEDEETEHLVNDLLLQIKQRNAMAKSLK